MFRHVFLISNFLFFYLFAQSQDSLYAREVVKYLTSKECFGRGYVGDGLKKAEQYIIGEIKKNKALPLFSDGFTQTFYQDVNTFPSQCKVAINSQELRPGLDYILNPSSSKAKGTFSLTKVDSTHYISVSQEANISLVIKKKLTYSVSHQAKQFCEIELLKDVQADEIKSIQLDVKNKFIKHFKSNNIVCYIKGSSTKDTFIVFSAHYDHLGGMGKQTYFPGANDNASGVSVVLNLIKYYTIHQPKYNIAFIFFAGEEAGLIGSKFFVESKIFDLKKIKFLINLDLLGTGDDGIMIVNGAIHNKEFEMLNQINNQQHLVKQIKKRGKAANSDHYWFSEAGVPCFFIYTMGGITAYHDVFDIEKTLPLTDYKDILNLITTFVFQL